MALMTDRQQRNLLIALGLTDFATRSRLSTAAFDVIVATAKRLGPTAARAAPRLGMTALQVGKQIAVKHPVLTAGAVIYYTYKNRDEIGALVEQGYEIVQPAVPAVQRALDPAEYQAGFERAREFDPTFTVPIPGIGPVTVPKPGIRRPFRKPSAFNKAIKAGMAAVKKSTSYGKRGRIVPAQKAFALVTKLASAKKKKKKAPKSGIRRKIWTAMKRYI
jgi:hypothetical protein